MFDRSSNVKWVEMDFNPPCEIIHKEYQKIMDDLVIHRPEDGHKDWYAITLYGFGKEKTNSHWEYNRRKMRPGLTDAGKKCIETMEWIKKLPYARIDDVRYLVIKPEGYIAEHIDVEDQNWLEPLNISITFPKGSEFYMDKEIVPYKPGTSMVLNIHYPHEVINKSSEDRLHLLIHGKKKKEFWDYVRYAKQP